MIEWLALLAVGLTVATLGHEATHMAAARALGGDARLHTHRRGNHWLTTTLMVSYTLPDRWEPIGPRLVGMAPVAVGLTVGACAFLLVEWSLGPASIVALATWATYTLTGGIEDIFG